MSRTPALLLAALLLPGALIAGGKKAPEMNVSFHLQADAGMESKKHVFQQMTAGKQITYRLSPEISHRDIVAFSSFPSDDGQSYGVVFQLSKGGAQRLSALSAAHRGKYLLAVVNGQVRDAVLIDKPVNDGMIVVWKRIGVGEIRLADNVIPRIGEDPKAWKQRLKEQK